MYRRLQIIAAVVLSCCLVFCASAADQPKGDPFLADASQGLASVASKPEPSPASAAVETDLPIQYASDFRDGKFDRDRIVPVGSLSLYSWTLLKREPRGLRITIPWHQGKQKQTLGYVGTSGLATGPHLDYRLQIKGRFVDPLRLKLPQGDPVPVKARERFERVREGRIAALNQAQPALVLEAAM